MRQRNFPAAVHNRWLPNRVVALYDPKEEDRAAKMISLLADKEQVDGKPTAYICRDLSCSAPVTEAEALEALLGGCRISEPHVVQEPL